MSEFNRERKDYHAVGKSIPKKDSSQLLLGKPVFTDDITPSDCLVVKLLRSPHAHALVEGLKKGTSKITVTIGKKKAVVTVKVK